MLGDDLRLRSDLPEGIEPYNHQRQEQRVAHEDIYINELSNSAWWRVIFSKRSRTHAHINVKELQALQELFRCVRKARRNQRFIVLLDSLVVLGACAKGRSPSRPLNHLLRMMLPDVLGFGLYPGYHFIPTRLNSSDAPSRFKKIRGPRNPEPPWVEATADGNYDEFDDVTSLPRQTKATAEWVGLLFSYCRLKGVNLFSRKDFDSTCGFPGEGPTTQPRDLAALDNRNHVPAVVLRRRKYLQLLRAWLHDKQRLSFDEFSCRAPQTH